MKKFIPIIALLLVSVVCASDNVKKMAEDYIASYSGIAVSEMSRSGVPASITLAQGMLESSFGHSPLAAEGNNHFGIKCHSDWTGASMMVDDDAPGECFRKYEVAEDSFRDHSDFLRFKQRYAFLFDYQADDYRSWAYGLKSAGYATDPAYSEKLIRLIETYGLSRFDKAGMCSSGDNDAGSVAVNVPEPPSRLEQPERSVVQNRRGTYSVTLEREVLSLNGIAFVYAREGENYKTIAALYDMYPRELARYNDIKDPYVRLSAGDKVYLQKKAVYAVKGLEKHVCSEGETLYEISQEYAVQLKSLLKLNGFRNGDIPMREDDTVLLRPGKTQKRK